MQPLWKTIWRFLRKIKTELPYDPAIPLLGMYLDTTIIQKDTCTPMFIAAIFTIARTGRQPKCPLTDKWIKKMWYIYTMDYSAIKKERNNAICSYMDGPREYHTKWSQKENNKYHMISLICGTIKWHKWTYLRNRNRLTDIENRLVVAKGEREGEGWIGRLGLANTNYYVYNR